MAVENPSDINNVSNETLYRQFNEQGYLIIRNLFTPEEVAEIRETFMTMNENGPIEGLSEIMRGGPNGYDASDPLSFYPRMMHPHRHLDKPVGPVATKYMLDARLYELLNGFMGEEPVSAQSMFYFKPAGARGQDLHQDNFYLRVAPGTCYAMWLAIDDSDRENGGMIVVPGTHDLEIACPEKADKTKFFTDHHVPVPEGLEEVPVDLKAGDVLFFNGSIIHGSNPNTSTDRFRRAFICHYVPKATRAMSPYPTMTFEGEAIAFEKAEGGGPCGMETKKFEGFH
jgi:phytanoyl-CoA hydroxylase